MAKDLNNFGQNNEDAKIKKFDYRKNYYNYLYDGNKHKLNKNKREGRIKWNFDLLNFFKR